MTLSRSATSRHLDSHPISSPVRVHRQAVACNGPRNTTLIFCVGAPSSHTSVGACIPPCSMQDFSSPNPHFASAWTVAVRGCSIHPRWSASLIAPATIPNATPTAIATDTVKLKTRVAISLMVSANIPHRLAPQRTPSRRVERPGRNLSTLPLPPPSVIDSCTLVQF